MADKFVCSWQASCTKKLRKLRIEIESECRIAMKIWMEVFVGLRLKNKEKTAVRVLRFVL